MLDTYHGAFNLGYLFIVDNPLTFIQDLRCCRPELGRFLERKCSLEPTRHSLDDIAPTWWMLPYFWGWLMMMMTCDPFGGTDTLFSLMTSFPSTMMSYSWCLDWWGGHIWGCHCVNEPVWWSYIHLMRRCDIWDEMHPLDPSIAPFVERHIFRRMMSPLEGF